MVPFFEVLYRILDLYIWVLIVSAVLSWLIAFNIVNVRQQFVYRVSEVLYRLTEPPLRRIRRFLPPVNGLDLSPLVLIFAIWLVQSMIRHYVFR